MPANNGLHPTCYRGVSLAGWALETNRNPGDIRPAAGG